MIGKRMTVFDVFNYTLLILFALTTLYPLWNILVISISTDQAYYSDWYHIVPKSLTLRSYLHNFKEIRVVRALLVSVFITVAGTILTMTLTSMAAFFLSTSGSSATDFINRKYVLYVV